MIANQQLHELVDELEERDAERLLARLRRTKIGKHVNGPRGRCGSMMDPRRS
jgi:hypothetical protein